MPDDNRPFSVDGACVACRDRRPPVVLHHSLDAEGLTVRTLERDGFVRRTEYAEPVRRVTYELTDLGRSLLEPMRVMCEWATDHWDELLDAHES